MEEKQKGLSSHTVALMIATALFFDVLQFLLTFVMMGWLAGLFAGLTFWWWFRQHGISFKKGAQLGSFGLVFLVEVIPALDVIPAWTLEVSYLALSNKATEILVNSVTKVPGGRLAAEATQKVYSFKKGSGTISTESAQGAA